MSKGKGVKFLQDFVSGIERRDGSFLIQTQNQTIKANQLVVAGGPFVNELLSHLELSLPLETFCQSKFVIPDLDSVVPRGMPFMICTICADPISLEWDSESRDAFRSAPTLKCLTEELQPGLHIKPEGQDRVKLGWAYSRAAESPAWSCSSSDIFPDVVMRGAVQYLPGLSS